MSNISYWESSVFLKNIDITIIGGGIVGLTCAIELRKLNPNSKIVVLEKGFLPSGASTKNAGFACFGSATEILDDLSGNTEDEVYNLIKLRTNGIKKLLSIVPKAKLDYKHYGGFEIFENKGDYKSVLEKLPHLNSLLHPIFNTDVFKPFHNNHKIGLNSDLHLIHNNLEGQLNPGMMMYELISLCEKSNIKIYNGFEVSNFIRNKNQWVINGNNSHIHSTKLILCNNAFAKKMIPNLDLKPARAQVLITKPIKDLNLKGCFHYDKGYYYFRNIDDRILIGGGRNLDFNAEQTFNTNTTDLIQNHLDSILKKMIIPGIEFEVDRRWTGTMGVGSTKSPLVMQLDEQLFCGVRMGGMGVAIGATIGELLAKLSSKY